MIDHPQWNGKRRGFYEAYFLLLNDPQQKFALWLRWLVVSPKDPRHQPQITLWGMISRAGEAPVALREVVNTAWPIGPGAQPGETAGSLGSGRLRWELKWNASRELVKLYPANWMYRGGWPKTKVTAPEPACQISGTVTLDDQTYQLSTAPGYVGHLWGTQMAEKWAWLQCGTFADHPEAQLEALSAQIKVGPLTTPPITLVRLAVDGQHYSFRSARRWLCQKTKWHPGGWNLEAREGSHRLELQCHAPNATAIGVTYTAPDWSRRYCYHNDFADLELKLSERVRGKWHARHTLTARQSARFESVGPSPDSNLPLWL